MEKQIRKFSDAKLEKELAFARGFASAPPISQEEQDWLDALEAAAIDYVETNHPLPRCPHGSALRDGAGEALEPPCGCRASQREPSVKQALKELREMFPEYNGYWIRIDQSAFDEPAMNKGIVHRTTISIDTFTEGFEGPTLTEAMARVREWNTIFARRFFCSCGAACTAEEYADHRKMGHDSGME